MIKLINKKKKLYDLFIRFLNFNIYNLNILFNINNIYNTIFFNKNIYLYIGNKYKYTTFFLGKNTFFLKVFNNQNYFKKLFFFIYLNKYKIKNIIYNYNIFYLFNDNKILNILLLLKKKTFIHSIKKKNYIIYDNNINKNYLLLNFFNQINLKNKLITKIKFKRNYYFLKKKKIK